MRRTCNTCLAVYGDECAELRFCAQCGDDLAQPVPHAPPTRPAPEGKGEQKSPMLAALLSFLLIGMGQVYLGQVEKGLLMLSVVLVLIMTVVLGPLGLVILIFNVADAYLLALKLGDGRPLRKWEFFFSSDKQSDV
jgi:TM2 domain-containing membrane protein YozV